MMSLESETAIRSNEDIMIARMTARLMSRWLGFEPVEQAQVAAVVSELAENMLLYACEGRVITRHVECAGCRGIELEFKDQGPGIDDLASVLHGRQLPLFCGPQTETGVGIAAAKRMMDEFEIKSAVGGGTTIVCRKWRYQTLPPFVSATVETGFPEQLCQN